MQGMWFCDRIGIRTRDVFFVMMESVKRNSRIETPEVVMLLEYVKLKRQEFLNFSALNKSLWVLKSYRAFRRLERTWTNCQTTVKFSSSSAVSITEVDDPRCPREFGCNRPEQLHKQAAELALKVIKLRILPTACGSFAYDYSIQNHPEDLVCAF